MPMQTPLKKARALGSAKDGTDHFFKQRLTGAANAVLAVFLVWLIVRLSGADHATVKSMLHHPIVAAALLALIASGTMHMRIGMQVIIEDYVHGEGAKLVLLALNTFFAAAIALISGLAILKLSLGA